MTHKLLRITRGKTEVLETGPLKKLNNRLRGLRGSTRKGSSGRGGQRYPVEYKIVSEEGAMTDFERRPTLDEQFTTQYYSDENLLERLKKLDDSEEHDVTSWEAKFLDSILFRGDGSLTPGQRESAMKMLEEYDF